MLKFEGLANRNSLPYADVYGLRPLDNVRTIFRGTLRYPGFADLMQVFKSIGLLESSIAVNPHHWDALVRQALEKKLGTLIMNDSASVRCALDDVVSPKHRENALQALHWLGIVPKSASETQLESASFDPSLPSLPDRPTAPIDLFATLLAHKLRYARHERDLVVLHHEIVSRPRGSQLQSPAEEEVHTSSLVAYGTKEASAMSRTVGLPVAFATLQILDGGVRARGVQGPTEREVYVNVLKRLEDAGLGVRESSRKASVGSGMRSVEAALTSRWREMQEVV